MKIFNLKALNIKGVNAKRIISIAAAVALAVSPTVLGGCKNTETKNASVAKSGGETELGGVKIKDGLINYYIYVAAVKSVYTQEDFTGDYASYNWEKKTDDGQKFDEKIKKEAFDEMVARQLLAEVAEEKGVTLSEEEIAEGENSIEEFKKTGGEEQLLTNIAALGLTSAEDYLELYKAETLYAKIESDFAQDPQKYAEGVELADYTNDVSASVKQILIKNDSEKFEDPKAAAEQVLAKAKAGEDFNALMREYNEDMGEAERVYTFGRGEMLKEFEDAAFDLECDEISDIVQSEYGYHIIKRVAGLSEFKCYLLTQINEEDEEAVMKKVSVKDIMIDINVALNKIKEQQKEAATAGDTAVESVG